MENTTHGTAMATKTAVSFANIFIAFIETQILSKTVFQQFGNTTYFRRHVFSLRGTSRSDTVAEFLRTSKLTSPTIKFPAEISDTETVFRHGCLHKGTHKTQRKSYP